jgi:predicted AlkP superfamily phosphohydrolase/phosphomutase
MRRAGSDSTILICSDHGFTASNELLSINTWLEQQGYLTWHADYDAPQDSIDLNPTSYQYRAFDMLQTKAYALITSSNGIYIPVRRTPEGEGLPPEEYESFRSELTNALLERCVDPATGEKLVKRVWSREEIFSGRFMNIAPDLTLTLRDHGFFSVRRSRQVHTTRPTVIGTHDPEGVFLARGPGIRQGRRVDQTHLIDIAPTVLCAMNLEIPSDLPGRPPTEIYEDGYRSPRWSSDHGFDPVSEDRTSTEEAEILARLKLLGYIEKGRSEHLWLVEKTVCHASRPQRFCNDLPKVRSNP